MLQIQLKVTKGDGTLIGAGDEYTPVNNVMHTLFSDVALTVGNKQIEGVS